MNAQIIIYYQLYTSFYFLKHSIVRVAHKFHCVPPAQHKTDTELATSR